MWHLINFVPMLLLNSTDFSIGFNGNIDIKLLLSRHSLVQSNNRNTRTMYEICSKLTIKITDKTSMTSLFSLLLTLNKFHTLLWCFCCWLWTSKWLLGNEQSILTESTTVHFMPIPLHPLKTSAKHRPSNRIVAWNELNNAADNLQKQPPEKF